MWVEHCIAHIDVGLLSTCGFLFFFVVKMDGVEPILQSEEWKFPVILFYIFHATGTTMGLVYI